MENHQGALALQVKNYGRILICLPCRDPVPQTQECGLCPATDSAAPAWAMSPLLPHHPETALLGNSAKLGLATASSCPLPIWSQSLPDSQRGGPCQLCVLQLPLSWGQGSFPRSRHCFGKTVSTLPPCTVAPWPALMDTMMVGTPSCGLPVLQWGVHSRRTLNNR